MNGHMFSLFDMAIAGVPVVAIGIWQLVAVNREIAKDRAAKSPESARHPVGKHGLDDG